MKTLQNFLVSMAMAALLVGCTVTKCNLTGTPGASYQGYVRLNNEKEREHYSGKLPDCWSTHALCIGFWVRLQECEYRKANTNDSLVLEVRTHGFKSTLTAQPGTEGVRVTREGEAYKTETF